MLIVLMMGCGAPDERADSPKVSDYYDLDTGTEVVPETGRWVYETLTVQSARCQKLNEILPFAVGEDFKVFQVDDRGFQASFPGIEQSTRCTLADAGFECGEMKGTTEVDGYDIVLVSDLSALGMFIDSDRVRGRYEMTIDCQGSICGAAAVYYGVSFPCEMAVEYVAQHQ